MAEGDPKNSQGRLIAGLLTALFVAGLDASVVNVMLPKLQTVFAVPLETATLLAAVYVAIMAAFGLPLGRCSDLFSSVKVFFLGVLFFGAGSLLCGLAQGFFVILAGRAVQGIGAAMLSASFGAVILHLIPKEKTGGAIGAAMTVMSVGSLVGPPLGGYFASEASWHWAFLLNVPLCAFSAILLLPYLAKETKKTEALGWSRFDPLGSFLGAVVMLAFPGGLHMVSQNGWSSPKVWGVLLLSLLAAVAFFKAERKAEYPLLPPHLFAQFRVKALAFIKLLLFIGLNGVMLIYPFFISSRAKFDEGDAGWLMLGCAVAMTVLTPLGGKLCDRIKPEGVMMLGSVILGLVMLASLSIPDQPSRLPLILSLAGAGAGFALILVSSTVSFLNLAPKEHAGIFSAVNSLLAPLGGAVGMSIYPLVYADAGFQASLVGVFLAALGILFMSLILKRRPEGSAGA